MQSLWRHAITATEIALFRDRKPQHAHRRHDTRIGRLHEKTGSWLSHVFRHSVSFTARSFTSAGLGLKGDPTPETPRGALAPRELPDHKTGLANTPHHHCYYNRAPIASLSEPCESENHPTCPRILATRGMRAASRNGDIAPNWSCIYFTQNADAAALNGFSIPESGPP